MKNIITTIFAFIFYTAIFAQEGHLSYKLDMQADGPDYEMVKAMMGDMTLDIFFDKNNSRVDLSMGFMGSMIFISKNEKEGLMLNNIAGMKYATYLDRDKVEEEESNEPKQKIEILDETKTILSYKCKKAIVYDEDGSAAEIWFTPDLKNYLAQSNQYNYEIEGLPLEIKIEKEGMAMVLTATSFSKKLEDKGIFKMEIPEDYKEMDYEEFLKMGEDN